MKERDIRGAKAHVNSRARMEITERGIRAAATLLLQMLNEVEPELEDAQAECIAAVKLMAEVLSHGAE